MSEIIRGGDFFAHESVTVDSTAGGVALTSATYDISNNAAQGALLTLEDAEVRFTVDGTAPTTSVGHKMSVGDQLDLNSNAQLKRFRAIRTGGTSGTLKVSYYRY